MRTKVHAQIVDGVATTTVDQVIRNNGAREAEGTWFLPLPAGAVADAFTMTVGGKEISGEVLDAGQARGVYEAIVRRRRDPGLLEYAGEGMLRARVVAGLMHFVLRGKTHSLLMLSPSQMPLRDALNE